jgi:hypothetical protein
MDGLPFTWLGLPALWEGAGFGTFLMPLDKDFPPEVFDLLVDFPFGLAVFLLSKGASSLIVQKDVV